jgi:hypothetical protein
VSRERRGEPDEAGLEARDRRRRVVDDPVPHRFEDVELVRTAADEQDSGEDRDAPRRVGLDPVFEEELVVTTRTVLKERVIVRKRVVETSSASSPTSVRSGSRSRPTTASSSRTEKRTGRPEPPRRPLDLEPV